MSDTLPPIVMVEWEDAFVVDDGAAWADNKPAAYKPQIFQSVGFLVLDVPEGVHLTQAWSPNMIAVRDQIPRAMIRSITPLGPVAAAPAKKGRK